MGKMEFESQICTTREQSKRLLALGLKKETADMVYHCQKSRTEIMQWELMPHPPTLMHTTHLNVDKLNIFKHKKPDGSIMTGEEYFQELWGNDIPAWSLHRLMEIMPKNIGCYEQFVSCYKNDVMYINDDGYSFCVCTKNDNLYDGIIDCIKWAIVNQYINQQFLEGKQCEK